MRAAAARRVDQVPHRARLGDRASSAAPRRSGARAAPRRAGLVRRHGRGSECVLPVGPDGQEVTDSFTFVHQPLTGDGSITARVAALTGTLPAAGLAAAGAGRWPAGGRGAPGLVPWAKAGLIIKDGTRPGSAYAAVMLTGAHGVRMQHDFTSRPPVRPAPAPAPRWLRLTRTGDTDHRRGVRRRQRRGRPSAPSRLPGLPATVRGRAVRHLAAVRRDDRRGRRRRRRGRRAEPGDRARSTSLDRSGARLDRPTWSAAAPTARDPGTPSRRRPGSP